MFRVSWATAVVAVYALSCQLFLANTFADEPKRQPVGDAGGNGQQVMVRARLVEVNRDKLRRLGIDFQSVGMNGPQSVGMNGPQEVVCLFPLRGTTKVAVFASSSPFFAFLEALCQNDVARILTEPTITTLDGRPASLSSGSIVDTDGRQGVDDGQFIGTKLEVVPHLVDNHRVRIEIRLSWRELDETVDAGQVATPRIRVREVDTGFEVNLGETFVSGGLVSKVRIGDQVEETELILLVTPELVSEKQTSVQPSAQAGQVAFVEGANP